MGTYMNPSPSPGLTLVGLGEQFLACGPPVLHRWSLVVWQSCHFQAASGAAAPNTPMLPGRDVCPQCACITFW